MKGERLDQILLRLGYVSEDDIKQALMRQKAHGGRMGSHLVYFKFITEGQLVHALSEQHSVPGFLPEEHKVATSAVTSLPYEIAADHKVVPLQYDESTGTLDVACVDPCDTDMLDKLKHTFRAERVNTYIASESQLLQLLAQHYYGTQEPNNEVAKIVELPDLFKDDGNGDVESDGANADGKTPAVLMISKSDAVRDFLAPIFEREGKRLEVMGTAKEVKAALKKDTFEQILVAQECVEEFSTWVRQRKIPSFQVEVSAFSTVSDALLRNPVPYQRITRSLFRSLQMLAEQRSATTGWVPPYVLICNDVQKVARSFGFRRLVVDGLQIAAYLLTPGVETNTAQLAFNDFQKTLEQAKALHFPYNVHNLLTTFRDICEGEREPRDKKNTQHETSLAAEILAIVWYHRVGLRNVSGKDAAAQIKSLLREQAGHATDLDVIETYIRLLESSAENSPGAYNQIFIVSRGKHVPNQFATRLAQAGFHTVEVGDIDEARSMNQRRAPVAIIFDYESFSTRVKEVSSLFKVGSVVLLYAFTRENDPSLTLDLMDAGFDDVFAPPFDFDIITARISKSLRGLSKQSRHDSEPGGFSADFRAFSFLDLLQTLGQSLKTVRIHLTKGTGETGSIHLNGGRIVHATSGDYSGKEAVYEVIGWQDDGAFVVEPEEQSPEQNVFASNEAIMMEGCRLLDESLVK